MSVPSRDALRWGQAIWLYATVYSVALVALDVWFGFHIGMNDFWGHYYQAENLDFTNPETLYDGFFPIGYPALLSFVPGDDFIQAGFAIAAAGRILYLGIFGSMALRFLPGAWAMFATVALSLIPRIFENVLTPGADLPMLVLELAGASCVLLATLREEPSRGRFAWMILGGALMGLSGLVRQHGLVMAAGVFLAAVALRPRDIGRIIVAGLACTLAYSPQIAISLWAGRGPFETFQYVNIYKMMHHVELRHVPLDLDPKVGPIIAEDPIAFFSAWWRYFVGMLPLLAPAAIALILVRERATRRMGAAILIVGVPYLAAVALGWSARAVLPLIPWAVLLCACIVFRTERYIATRIGRPVAIRGILSAAALLLAVWASERNSGLVRGYLYDHHSYTEVAQLLEADGVVHPKQVYSTDGTFYLPMMPPYWPYFDGTWGLFSLYKFRERYPQLNVSALPDFRDECVRQGITHLALWGDPTWISPALGNLVQTPQDHPEFEYLGRIGGYALFRRRDA